MTGLGNDAGPGAGSIASSASSSSGVGLEAEDILVGLVGRQDRVFGVHRRHRPASTFFEITMRWISLVPS